MWIYRKIILMFIFGAIVNASSSYDNFFQSAGREFDVEPMVIKSVALTENRKMNPRHVRKNRNGTYDVGLMQINTVHLKELSKKLGISTIEKLKDPYSNIRAGAYLLRKIIDSRGYSISNIGIYHSKTKKYKRIWLKRFKKIYSEVSESMNVVRYESKKRYSLTDEEKNLLDSFVKSEI